MYKSQFNFSANVTLPSGGGWVETFIIMNQMMTNESVSSSSAANQQLVDHWNSLVLSSQQSLITTKLLNNFHIWN